MPFEEPKFEQSRKTENKDMASEEKEAPKNAEKGWWEDIKDLPPEEKEALETAMKQEKEAPEIIREEIKLRSTLEEWMEQMDPEIRQRIKNFGMKESVLDEVKDNLNQSFEKDLERVKKTEELKEGSFKAVAELSDKENKTELKNSISQLSQKDILVLLNKKLSGEAAPEEKKILDIFSKAEKGEKSGFHNPLTGEIEVSLLNSKELGNYKSALMHEFTHKALAELVPDITKKETAVVGLRALERAFGVKKAKENITEQEKTQDLFFQNLAAINESLATRVEGYYGEKREPLHGAYKDKTHAGTFEKIYSRIDAAATGQSLEEFDHFAAHIYSFFANKWDKNLSPRDLQEIAVSTIKEMDKLKKEIKKEGYLSVIEEFIGKKTGLVKDRLNSEIKKKEIPGRDTDKEDKELERARRGLGEIFDAHKDGSARVKDILSKIKPFLDSDLIDGEKVRQSLEKYSIIENRNEFTEKVFSSLEPILDLKRNNPEAFEKIQREAFIEQSGFTKLNEILSYGGYKDKTHIHLAPAETLRIGKLRSSVQEGLTELAKIVKDNKKIKEITATSWIIAKHPRLLEKLGFTIEGEIDEKTRKKHFAYEERKVYKAKMTREEFLDKYLKKE